MATPAYGPIGDVNDWLDEYTRISFRLSRVLMHAGVGTKRWQTLDILARQLGLDPRQIQVAGYMVLETLIPVLEQVLEEDPGDWLDDLEAAKPIADAAVREIKSPEVLILAMIQFGWGEEQVGRTPQVRHLTGDLREALARQLAERIRPMLPRFRNWDASESARGIVRVSSRSRPEAS